MDIFKPIQLFADVVTYKWLGIADTYLGNTVNFFIYDVIKIGLLLIVINYLMAITRYYFPMERARNILTKRRWFGLDYVLAAVLGVVTPFCSCSSIPLFIGFIGAGIPLGVTFAFLIASPLVNESSLYLFPAMFGWKVTIIYNLLGLSIAVLGGLLIQSLHLEKYIKSELLNFKSKKQVVTENGGVDLSFKKLIIYFWKNGFVITKTLFPYVVLGVGIGALIHGFVPASLVEDYLSVRSWWSIPLATLLGAPLYANSVSVIPIMEALIGKGVPLGTALAFMTAIVTISLPEAMILKKVMRWQLLVAFFGITLIGIMIMGYVFLFQGNVSVKANNLPQITNDNKIPVEQYRYYSGVIGKQKIHLVYWPDGDWQKNQSTGDNFFFAGKMVYDFMSDYPLNVALRFTGGGKLDGEALIEDLVVARFTNDVEDASKWPENCLMNNVHCGEWVESGGGNIDNFIFTTTTVFRIEDFLKK